VPPEAALLLDAPRVIDGRADRAENAERAPYERNRAEDPEPELTGLKGIQGLMDKLGPLEVSGKDSPEIQVSAAEFLLEGLYAHKRIGRSEERVFTAGEKQPKHPEKHYEREEPPFRGRRPYN